MKHKNHRLGVLALLGIVILAAACGSPTPRSVPPTATSPAPPAQPALEGTDWVLASLRGAGPLAGTQVLLSFTDGQATGFGGCNHYGGPYTAAEDGSLSIVEVAVTAEGCLEPEGVLEQESAYVDALTAATAYRVSAGRLEILDAQGQVSLAFTPRQEFAMDPADLLGSRWRLVSMGDSAPLEDSVITLVFQSENRVSGDAGCRGYVASYQAAGDDIGFPMIAMLGAAERCAEALLEQDATYTTHLELATTYRLGEASLELFTARGDVLLYEPLPAESDAPLEGTPWTLAAFLETRPDPGLAAPILLPAEPLPGSEITATFQDGQVRGSAGCNSYGGGYTVDGSAIALGTLAVTEMWCAAPEGVMDQEQRYLALLGEVTSARVDGAQLWLETADGRALVFRSAGAPAPCTSVGAIPPEDAELVPPTLLEATPDPAAPGQAVQIRGTGGYLTWEDECGTGVVESARDFSLTFDGAPAGSLQCYVNTCLATLIVPADAAPGAHSVSVEGGSSLRLEIVAPQPPAAGPAILSFRASVDEADPGQTIELKWETTGATSAVLYALLPSGQLGEPVWQVAPSGAMSYQIPADARNVKSFFLYVSDGEGRSANATLSVRLTCPVSWFFAPAPEGCGSDPILSWAAEQPFERGTMIWLEAQDLIYVLYADGGASPAWEAFTDEWDEGEPDHDPTLTPPASRLQPMRGFGLVWRTYSHVRERLGWALAPEAGFDTVVQGTTLFKYNSLYLRALDGGVWYLGPERSSWQKIGAP